MSRSSGPALAYSITTSQKPPSRTPVSTNSNSLSVCVCVCVGPCGCVRVCVATRVGVFVWVWVWGHVCGSHIRIHTYTNATVQNTRVYQLEFIVWCVCVGVWVRVGVCVCVGTRVGVFVWVWVWGHVCGSHIRLHTYTKATVQNTRVYNQLEFIVCVCLWVCGSVSECEIDCVERVSV